MTQVIITGGIDLSSGSVPGTVGSCSSKSGAKLGQYPRGFPGADQSPVRRSTPCRCSRGCPCRGGQWQPDRTDRNSTFHRNAGYDGDSPWARACLYRRPAHQHVIGTVHLDWVWLYACCDLPCDRGDIPHCATLYAHGKFTYAIGANPQAARVSGINVGRHLIIVYAIAGLLAGLGGVVTAARAATGQSGMGLGYELDAIAATVIGGTSLTGGIGRIGGTVIGMVILGIMTSGFTFLGVDVYYQDIVKGVIIVAAVSADMYRQRKRRKA